MRAETIYIPKEAYFKLRNRSRVERGGKPLTDEQLERSWLRIPASRKDGDLINVDGDSLGGGDQAYFDVVIDIESAIDKAKENEE